MELKNRLYCGVMVSQMGGTMYWLPDCVSALDRGEADGKMYRHALEIYNPDLGWSVPAIASKEIQFKIVDNEICVVGEE